MDAFTTITGPAAPLLRANVDTDMIIPAQRLIGAGRDGLGRYAFERFRFNTDGTENPDFPLNQAPYRASPILLAGENFGCGSSREGAVWALRDLGLRCFIAPSFGDIFYNNCFQNGMLPVRLAAADVQRIAEQTAASPSNAYTSVDLERQVVITPNGEEIPFSVDPRKRSALLEGLDEIALTMKRRAEIQAWQARDQAARPWAWEGLAL